MISRIRLYASSVRLAGAVGNCRHLGWQFIRGSALLSVGSAIRRLCYPWAESAPLVRMPSLIPWRLKPQLRSVRKQFSQHLRELWKRFWYQEMMVQSFFFFLIELSMMMMMMMTMDQEEQEGRPHYLLLVDLYLDRLQPLMIVIF